MEKILPISLKLNFTPNTIGCYKLTQLKKSILIAVFHSNYKLAQTLNPPPAAKLKWANLVSANASMICLPSGLEPQDKTRVTTPAGRRTKLPQ